MALDINFLTENVWLTLCLSVIVFLVLYVNKKYIYWSSRGITGPRPIFPFGYNLERALSQSTEFELKLMKNHGKVYGVYAGLLPTLTLIDNELIKQVLVKDFHYFKNRRDLNRHEYFNLNLFNIEATDWKRIRTIISPTFSSGRLRAMAPLMNQCVDKFVHYLNKVTGKTGEGTIITKKVVSGFTIDVIASTSFATETDANDDDRKETTLLRNCMQIFVFNSWKVAMIYAFPPKLLSLLNIKSWFDEKVFDYFVQLTRQIIQQRRALGTDAPKRNDLVQLLMDSFVYGSELKNTDYNRLTASADVDQDKLSSVSNGDTGTSEQSKAKLTLSEKEIITQCILFFTAGFDTTTITLNSCQFELAQNPAVQDRLKEELTQLEELGSNSDEYHEKVNKLPYLDAVLKETLRKYSSIIRLERRLDVDEYKLGDIPLNKGVMIEIPIHAVHHHPDYYPDPFRYNPDRFMPENKHLIKPYTYLPFGDGPRNCIGLRFAYQVMKLCLAKIVLQFQFEPTPETPAKLKFKPGQLFLTAYPFPLKVCKR